MRRRATPSKPDQRKLERAAAELVGLERRTWLWVVLEGGEARAVQGGYRPVRFLRVIRRGSRKGWAEVEVFVATRKRNKGERWISVAGIPRMGVYRAVQIPPTRVAAIGTTSRPGPLCNLERPRLDSQGGRAA